MSMDKFVDDMRLAKVMADMRSTDIQPIMFGAEDEMPAMTHKRAIEAIEGAGLEAPTGDDMAALLEVDARFRARSAMMARQFRNGEL